MAKEKNLPLSAPVTFGKETLTELTVTRKLKYLRGHALRVTSDGKGSGGVDIDFATLIDLAAKMVEHPPALIEELEEEDQASLIQEARDFLLTHLGGGSQE
ncbi:hypothetical protein [Pseudomonas abietaniphila]|uniref:Phage tail assembly chaperone protein, E, or 41 or 14 n=1 Tax=Pseudomonas abietaniphila TaxID=89065 RepID=A0A1G8LI81_9PSED|nr:hypothetical protein [Pseudomonas abietaniphila]SDI55338.1 hypothetical protein SAMN05216605_114151 [Pseudomonas abietaniphila]